MGTVNFSVPDEVKKAFNQAFAGENNSAVVLTGSPELQRSSRVWTRRSWGRP